MTAPRRTRAQMVADTTEKLVSAARERFHEDGYAATSMDELCAQVGLTRGALYHHFGGKEGLFEAVVTQIHDEISERLTTAYDAEPDKWVAFRACCRNYLSMALEPELRRILFQDAPAVLGERLREIDGRALDPIIGALEELMASDLIVRIDAEAMARMLNGAMGDAALWIASTNHPRRSLARALQALDVLLDGIERRPPKRTKRET